MAARETPLRTLPILSFLLKFFAISVLIHSQHLRPRIFFADPELQRSQFLRICLVLRLIPSPIPASDLPAVINFPMPRILLPFVVVVIFLVLPLTVPVRTLSAFSYSLFQVYGASCYSCLLLRVLI